MPYSPWSEQASWALDHHALPYKRHIYTPMIEAPLLRLRTGKWRGPVTVPVLIEGDKQWTDSWDIAQHAEAIGKSAPLFPAGKEDAMRQWYEKTQSGLAEGRLRTTRRVKQNPGALIESVPVRVPKVIEPIAKYISLVGANYLQNKYQALAREGAMRNTLDEIRAYLNNTKSGYLLGDFSFADIMAAMVLQFVEPPANGRLPLGPETVKAWSDPEFSDEYRDLLKWRDALYRNHRGERAKS